MIEWLRPTSADKAGDAGGPRWQPMRIVARAMCCPVGHSSAAATAAINARINHFRETEFVALGGVPLNGSTLFDLPVWGAERLAHMLTAVLDEISAAAPAISRNEIGIVLQVGENIRPGVSPVLVADAASAALEAAQVDSGRFHGTPRTIEHGKGAIGSALHACAEILDGADAPPYVLLCAVDSLLNAGTIGHYLSQERLLTDTNTDGFIPGEAAAAVLLSRQPGGSTGVWIDAVATANEPWRTDGGMPMRAAGLTQAIRAALAMAGRRMVDLDFHASGMSGEGWYAKEVSLALSRCIEERKPTFPHHMVARSVGETGAAGAVLTLAWLAGTMPRTEHGPGQAGLLHFAGDDGARAAIVVRARQ